MEPQPEAAARLAGPQIGAKGQCLSPCSSWRECTVVGVRDSDGHLCISYDGFDAENNEWLNPCAGSADATRLRWLTDGQGHTTNWAIVFDAAITGTETDEPIVQQDFCTARRMVESVRGSAPEEAGWVLAKENASLKIFKNKVSASGVKKFAVVCSPAYGKGIPVGVLADAWLDFEWVASTDDRILTLEKIGERGEGNDVVYSRTKMPMGLKDRDTLVLRACERAPGATFEALERSTTDERRPIELSSKETGKKRKFIRGYQFWYWSMAAQEADPQSSDMTIIVATDLRQDVDKKLMSKLAVMVSTAPLPIWHSIRLLCGFWQGGWANLHAHIRWRGMAHCRCGKISCRGWPPPACPPLLRSNPSNTYNIRFYDSTHHRLLHTRHPVLNLVLSQAVWAVGNSRIRNSRISQPSEPGSALQAASQPYTRSDISSR